MFTRIIDPFNHQAWNKTPPRQTFYEYIPKTPITKNKKKKLISNTNTSCEEEFTHVPETWIIQTEQNDFNEEIYQPEIDNIEADDFVMV